MITITNRLAIPEDELAVSASRSGGPGGQNVNKVNTRIMLRFDVANSPSLSEPQRRLILSRLATRITKDGVLVVGSQRHRTQSANRAAAVARFAELLRDAVRRRRVRKRTKPSHSSKVRRLQAKKRRGQLKKLRSERPSMDE